MISKNAIRLIVSRNRDGTLLIKRGNYCIYHFYALKYNKKWHQVLRMNNLFANISHTVNTVQTVSNKITIHSTIE